MWIVLLDQSGSMADPFSSTSNLADRRVRHTEREIKLDAAKESLLIELGRNPDMPVALFSFTTTARLIYEGMAGNSSRIGTELARVAAGGGTDIAAALDAAIAWAGPASNRPTVTSIILVSDGLSDATAAAAAADRCRAEGLPIQVILIDPDEDTTALAARLARITGGRWDPVVSRQDLAAAATRHGDHAAALADRAAAGIRGMEQEADEILAETADRERVQFTASYPGLITAVGPHPLTVFLHLASMRAELEGRLDRLSIELGPYAGRSSGVAKSIIEPGMIVELRPVLANLRCIPARSDLVWREQLEEVRFAIEYAGPDQQEAICGGHVEVHVGGLLIAQLPVSMTMTASADPTRLPPRHATVEMLRRVFASYSHDDEDIVRRCRSAYRALGIQLFVDRDDIEAGRPWWGVLQRMIVSHDLFQLYWSASAAASQAVAAEWRLALDVARTKPEHTNFIRPVYWQRPMPPPPAALADIHFRYLDPQSLDQSGDIGTGQRRERQLPGGAEVEVTFPVLACAPDPTGTTTDAVRRALRAAIPLVEHVTGLRYYPPPTLLVDDYVVEQFRQVSEPHRPGERADPAVLLELLRSLCPVFHVDHRGRDLGATLPPPDRGDFSHVRVQSEAGFLSLVTGWLAGTDPLTTPGRETFAMILDEARRDHQARQDRLGFSTRRLADDVDRVLAVATVADRTQLAGMLENLSWDRDSIRQLSETMAFQAALIDRAGTEQFLRIAARYDTALHRCFDGEPTTLPTTGFPAYAARFTELLVRFAARLADERADEEFKIGYSVGDRAVAWIDTHHPGLVLSRAPVTWGFGADRKEEYTWQMTRAGYRTVLDDVCRLVLAEIESGSPASQYLRTAAATYGAFTSGVGPAGAGLRQALERGGIPGSILPPATPAVLICADALDRLAGSLRECGVEPDIAQQRAMAFLFATTVHEHFHAAVATSVDSAGHAPFAATDPDQWQAGSRLNEALAAWAQWHAARDDPALFADCAAYIRAGDYPGWPYRGADALEEEYQERGLAAVRAWVAMLRTDPEVAQAAFDEMVTARSSG
jgi:TIR domain/von Willebrand factor type A domain